MLHVVRAFSSLLEEQSKEVTTKLKMWSAIGSSLLLLVASHLLDFSLWPMVASLATVYLTFGLIFGWRMYREPSQLLLYYRIIKADMQTMLATLSKAAPLSKRMSVDGRVLALHTNEGCYYHPLNYGAAPTHSAYGISSDEATGLQVREEITMAPQTDYQITPAQFGFQTIQIEVGDLVLSFSAQEQITCAEIARRYLEQLNQED